MSNPEQYLFVDETARRLGCTEAKVKKLIKEGKLATAERSRSRERWRIKEVSVAEYELSLVQAKDTKHKNFWCRVLKIWQRLRQHPFIVPLVMIMSIVSFVLTYAIPTINDMKEFYQQYSPSEPMPPHKYNIAVAPTARIDGSSKFDSLLDCNILGKALGTTDSDIGESLIKNLIQKFDQNQLSTASYSLRGPELIGAVRCRSAQERLKYVSDLALAHNASVIIYSTIVSDGISEKLNIEMYISERDFVYAPELTGIHSFGEIEIYNKNKPPDADSVSVEIQSSQYIELLSVLAIAIRYYEGGDYQIAYDLLIKVADCKEKINTEGKPEVFLLLLGNIAGKLRNFTEAVACFNLALQLNKQYARGYIGMAEVYYQYALSGSTKDLASALFDQAEASLGKAEKLIALPDIANVTIKIDFARGRIALYRSQFLGEAKYSEAKKHFASVVNKSGSRSPTSEHLALAYGYLGVISKVEKDNEEAISQLQIAIETTNSSQAKAGFFIILADVFASDCKISDAIKYYDAALNLETDESRRTVYVESLAKLQNLRKFDHQTPCSYPNFSSPEDIEQS
jgi:tetratricopeptide (TPR) repeat protein